MMSLPQLPEKLPTLACNAVLVGHAQKADVIWTREDFFAICTHMQNGNEPNFFMVPYRDKTGGARFAKAHFRARADRHASLAWAAITGDPKYPGFSIGYYPRDGNGQSRWGAMDFDVHDGDQERTRRLALQAFDLLYRHPELFVTLTTSSSGGGWHLFVFSRDFHLCSEWTRLFRQAAKLIGEPISKGRLEIFPTESRGPVGYGIRAPGTWDPKSDTFGEILFENAAKPLQLLQGEAQHDRDRDKVCLYNLRSSALGKEPSIELLRGKGDSVELLRGKAVFRGPKKKWRDDFAITAPKSRRGKLHVLIDAIFYEVGREVARKNAELQYAEAAVAPKSSRAEHLEDFDEYWTWRLESWLNDLAPEERQVLERFSTESVTDAFRIVRNFWRRRKPGETDFKIVCDSPDGGLAQRLGVIFQGAAQIRKKLQVGGAIKLTKHYVPRRYAARFRWVADQ